MFHNGGGNNFNVIFVSSIMAMGIYSEKLKVIQGVTFNYYYKNFYDFS